jgi:hypothetical protein
MQTTQLASGKITNTDTLTVELVEPPDLPPTILIRWPRKPSITTPARYDTVASDAMRTLANAVIKLAAIKLRKRL